MTQTDAISKCIEDCLVAGDQRPNARFQLAALLAERDRLRDCLEHIADCDEEEIKLAATYARTALEGVQTDATK